MSLSTDIVRSWRSPRAVIRARLARLDGERSALFYLMMGCLLIFVAQWPRLSREAAMDDGIPFEGLMAGALFGWLFLAPLFFYAIAWLLGLALRLARRATPFLAVRLALFWALLAVSPLVLFQGALAALAGPGALAFASGLLVLALFMAILGAGLRVALEAGQGAA